MIHYKIICVPIDINVSSYCFTEEETTVLYEVECDTIDLYSVTDEHQHESTIVHTQEDIEP